MRTMGGICVVLLLSACGGAPEPEPFFGSSSGNGNADPGSGANANSNDNMSSGGRCWLARDR